MRCCTNSFLEPHTEVSYEVEKGRRVYVHQITSELFVNDTQTDTGRWRKIVAEQYLSF